MSRSGFRLTRWLLGIGLGIGLAVLCETSFAAYPDHAIRLVVPFAAGGFTDTLARVVAQKLGQKLGQAVIVDNRAGAGGNIGAEVVAKSAPDGYTLFLATNATHGINPTLYKDIPFDAVKDFTPVVLMVSTPNLLLVTPSLPVKSVAELVALAKSKPGQLSYGSTGIGTSTHLQGELFKSVEGIQMTHVPYRGSSQAVIDLIGGTVQVMFDNIPFEYPQIKAGKVRALAVTSKKRSPLLPDVPTMTELGIPGFEFGAWFGIAAPANTPPDIVAKINADVNQILAMPDVQAKLPGTEMLGGSPQQFAAFIGAEIAKWRTVIRSINLQAQ
jgi:tripartite-type tricarboxylate transporter receptor subunit TctC